MGFAATMTVTSIPLIHSTKCIEASGWTKRVGLKIIKLEIHKWSEEWVGLELQDLMVYMRAHEEKMETE